MLMDVRESRLPNGVRVLTSSLPQMQSVSMGVWFGTGSRHEPARLSGVSHFIEHLLFKGTARRSARDISAAIEGRGGYLNAFTQEESTCYYVRMAYDQIWRAAEVLADMVLNSRFEPEEFERERGVIIEEILMYRDQPQHYVQELLTQELWRDHPMGRSIAGTPRTMSAMKRDDVLAFMGRRYVASRTVVVFAGRVDHDACVAGVAKLLGGQPRGRTRAAVPVTNSTSQGRCVCEAKPVEQSHAALAFRLFGRRDPRRYALRVFSAVMGENMSSRLFQVLREKHGMAYSVHSTCHLYGDTGAFVISAGLDRRRTDKALALTARALRRIKQRGVGERELKRARDYVVGHLRLGLESTSSQMIWLGENALSRERLISVETTIERIQAVTGDDIRKLADTVLRPSRATLALVAPEPVIADRARLRSIALEL